ncbi:MAG: amidohydrolase [Planctomycetes bacterium]|nr:amidohydrolase [Planctomycetota bacterium]MCB9903781.1 amidohydrolase [Planctomycetota bacterium]
MLPVCHLFLVLAQAPAASAYDGAAERAPVAVLFENGSIRLGDGNGTVVSGLLAVDGVVLSVGPVEKLEEEAAGYELERVDLAGGWAVPGLQDAHGHVENYGRSLEVLDLREFTDYASMVAAVAEVAAERPAGEWIEGRGWDQNLWPEGKFPHHALLSEAVPDHPVILDRVDGHAVLCNKRALDLSGLGGLMLQEPKIDGGRVLVDDKRQATGVLIDNATDLVRQHVPEPDRATRMRRILRAQEALLADGLTCVHDMGIDEDVAGIYRELESQGRLQLRIVAYLSGNDGLSKEMLKKYPWRSARQDRLDIVGVKLLADGALGSRGAALLADYSDAPGERGALLLKEDRLTLLVHEAWQAGLQPAIHAIGDRANRVVLDVYERMVQVDENFRALRPRIEHAQVVSPRDWPRFPSLGVIPSMQPVHAASDMAWAPARLGPERSRGAYAWRQLAGGVAPLAFGSDFPVESPNPLHGIAAARTRRDLDGREQAGFEADDALDGEAAVLGFTFGAAYACGQEERRGRLMPGFAADLTVLKLDPVQAPPELLARSRATMTVIDGEVVYPRELAVPHEAGAVPADDEAAR